MRPRELTVEGFRSHRTRATFDFRGRRLIGVVGPIGAGKSSLLDAVVFALYGKTPVFESATRSLIHQLADTAHVQLVFEVDGQIWRATRAIRRKGQSQHKLERLDTDDRDAPAIETVVQEKPVRERIEQLLGMDFAAFCRSVLLAQGRFDEFLKATERQRTDVLKGVFGYERFDAALLAAKERAARAERDLAWLAEEGERLAEARATLEAARDDAVTAAARHTELEGAAGRVRALAERRREVETDEATAAARAVELTAILAGLPPGDEVAAAVELAERADDAVAGAEATLGVTSSALADAEAMHAAVAERVGDRAAMADVAELVARMEREVATAIDAEHRETEAQEALDRALADAGAREAERDEAVAAVTTTGAAATAAAAAVAVADEALHRARHGEMAAELRRGLAPGEPCPVCAQTVVTVPKAARAPTVAHAETALTRARLDDERAREAHTRAQADEAAANARHAAATAEVPRQASAVESAAASAAATRAAVAATQSELVDRLGEGDPRELVEARRRELEDAERGVTESRRAEQDARAALDEVRADRVGALGRLDAVRAAVLLAWGRLGETLEVPAIAAGVRDGYVALGERLGADLVAAREAKDAARQAAADVGDELRSELEGVGLAPDDDVEQALGHAQGARAAAAARVAGLEETLARGTDLEARLADAITRRDLAKRLVADLQPSRFLDFLLAEERRALAALGSVHLDELSDGAYRFTDDDTFDVVDLNAASTPRSSNSLSGGETFLASLALALALAEMVARGGGRLDSFFLDEGFGSLDPEHLDRAMDGIARLVAGHDDRLVVLVSHVEQMRQALEDLIVLDKDPRTGDSIVVRGAARES